MGWWSCLGENVKLDLQEKKKNVKLDYMTKLINKLEFVCHQLHIRTNHNKTLASTA
jgi:hypothetical protein